MQAENEISVLEADHHQFFVPSLSSMNTVCLNFAQNPWHLYSQGYKHAANLLLKHLDHTQSSPDALIYPFFYLCRHYIELTLKDIIRTECVLLDRKMQKKLSISHDISKLWCKAKHLSQEIFIDHEDLTALDEISSLFLDLSELEPSPTSFRYPIDLNGTASHPNIRYLSIRDIAVKMNEIATLLEGIAVEIGIRIDYKAEMQEYWSI